MCLETYTTNIRSSGLIALVEDSSFSSKHHNFSKPTIRPASKVRQALYALSLTSALKHTLLQFAVKKLWFATYPKGFSQGSGTIILQTVSASHKYFQSKRLALGTWFPVTLFQSGCQYLEINQAVYTTSASHSEGIQMCFVYPALELDNHQPFQPQPFCDSV